jgi:hypothetical protein
MYSIFAMLVAADEEPSRPASPTPRFVLPSILASRQTIRPRRTKSANYRPLRSASAGLW